MNNSEDVAKTTLLSKILTVSFAIFILVIVGTYSWVCLTGIFDVADRPIEPERFNQIWTSLAALVGAIVGWLIREVSSGYERQAIVSGERSLFNLEKSRHLEEVNLLSKEISTKTKENLQLVMKVRDKELDLEKAKEEIKVLGAIKTSEENDV